MTITPDASPSPRRRLAGPVLLLAFVIGAFLVMKTWVPDEEALLALLHRLGQVNLAVYLLIYVALTLALVPVSLLNLSGGLILGYAAVPVVLTATVTGSGLAFLASRGALRETVLAWIHRRPRMVALERALSRDAFRLTIFLRMSPVMPFGAFNYVAGALPLTGRAFVLATFIGLLPRTVLGVLIGSGGRAALEAGGFGALPPATRIGLGLGLAATVVVLVLVGRVARAALRDQGLVDAPGDPTATAGGSG